MLLHRVIIRSVHHLKVFCPLVIIIGYMKQSKTKHKLWVVSATLSCRYYKFRCHPRLIVISLPTGSDRMLWAKPHRRHSTL